MANPTTAFGWVMPAATDLVTDLPADFNVFGQGVDTSMQYLLGGTTGQVLAKTSATNMAFTWTTPQVGDITDVVAGTGISGGGTSGSVTITNSMATALTTAGDIIYRNATVPVRLGIGTAGQVLAVNSGATAPEWIAAPNNGRTLINTGGTALSGSSTTVSAIPATYTDLIVVITGWQTGSDSYHYLYCNADQTAGNYGVTAISSANGAAATLRGGTLTDSMGNGTYRSGNSTGMCVVTIYNYANAFRKNLQYNSAFNIDVVPGVMGSVISNVAWNASAAISSLTFKTTAGTYSAGTIYVYGAN